MIIKNFKIFCNEELEYDEVSDGKYKLNDDIVDIIFFVDKYNEWNGEGGYSTPSESSVLEFIQNNYEDFSHNEKLKKLLLKALMKNKKSNK